MSPLAHDTDLDLFVCVRLRALVALDGAALSAVAPGTANCTRELWIFRDRAPAPTIERL